jgi:hypothetical protein
MTVPPDMTFSSPSIVGPMTVPLDMTFSSTPIVEPLSKPPLSAVSMLSTSVELMAVPKKLEADAAAV